MESAHAFHQILLDPSRSGDDAVDHLMLGEVTDDLPHSTRDHVGSVAEVDCASLVGPIDGVRGFLVVPLVEGLVGQPPADHAVDDLDGLGEVGSLESCSGVALEDLLVVDPLIEIIALHYA